VNTRYLEDDDIDEEPRDREISLGATTILGIFFLLAIVCAVFFGFGYSIGRKSSTAAIASVSSDTVEASSIKTTGAAKPAPGLAPTESASSTATADDTDSPQVPQPEEQPAPAPEPVKHAAAKPAPTKSVPTVVAVAPITKPASPVLAPRPATASAGAPSLVQVAAVSHQEDADTLLNALKRRGYNVTVRHEPQDKLLHVQIGPLATRKDADAMRQRLLSDGYNAIVK
jgi:DedD protein